MRWVIRLALLLLALGALRAVLGSGTEPTTSDVDEVLEAPPPEEGPELTAAPPKAPEPRGTTGDAAPRYAPLPADIRSHVDMLDEASAKAVWAWVREEPSRYLDLLHDARSRDVSVSDVGYWARRRASALVSWIDPAFTDTFVAWLLRAVATETHDPSVAAGIVESLRRLASEKQPWPATLALLARAPTVPASVRLNALGDLVRLGGADADVAETVRAALRIDTDDVDLRTADGQLGTLVGQLMEDKALLRACVPELLALAEKGGAGWQSRTAILRALVQSGDRSPALLRLVAARAFHEHGSLREQMADLLYGGDVEEVLAWMETAPPHARIVGVSALFKREVAPERLHAHVLAVLGSGHDLAIQRAVDAIPLVRVPGPEVLRAVEPLLLHEDPKRQRLGVKALGLLARVPGEHDDAIRRLGRVAQRAAAPEVRVVAVASLLMHAARPRLMIDGLAGMLGDSEAHVRREAADALGELAATHPDARRALEGARNDGDDDVRALIAYWLDQTDDDE